MQGGDVVDDDLVGQGHAVEHAQVLDPVVHQEQFLPDLRVAHVAEQRPALRAVAQAQAAQRLGGANEVAGALGGNPVFDGDQHHAPPRVEDEARLPGHARRRAGNTGGVHFRQARVVQEDHRGQQQAAGGQQRAVHGHGLGEMAPEERTQRQATVQRGLVQRQGARLDPVGDEDLHRRVVGGEGADPAAATEDQHREQDPEVVHQAEGQQDQRQGEAGQADQPAAADPLAQARDLGAAEDRAEAEGAEHVAVDRRVAVRVAVRQQRQQGPDCAGGEAEGEGAHHHQAGDGGVLGEAQRRGDAFEDAFRRQAALGHLAPPLPDRPDQGHVAEAVEQEHPGRSHRAQQQAAEGRAGGAGDVVVDAVEQHRVADHARRHLLVDRRLPRRDGHRAAEGDPEDGDDQQHRVEVAEEGQQGGEHRSGHLEAEPPEHDLAPVVVVGDDPGEDRQQHQRQCRGDLDHRHHQRAGVGVGDHPGGGHRLGPGAEVGEQVADPDDAEGLDRERRPGAGAFWLGRLAFGFEGQVVLGRNGLEHQMGALYQRA